jgi:hypothetical protein
MGTAQMAGNFCGAGGARDSTKVCAGRGVGWWGQIYAADGGHAQGWDESGVGDGEQLQHVLCMRMVVCTILALRDTTWL